jgi:hypothetical protein
VKWALGELVSCFPPIAKFAMDGALSLLLGSGNGRGWQRIKDDAVDVATGFDEGQSEISFQRDAGGIHISLGQTEVGVEVAFHAGFIHDQRSQDGLQRFREAIQIGLHHYQFVGLRVIESHASLIR